MHQVRAAAGDEVRTLEKKRLDTAHERESDILSAKGEKREEEKERERITRITF